MCVYVLLFFGGYAAIGAQSFLGMLRDDTYLLYCFTPFLCMTYRDRAVRVRSLRGLYINQNPSPAI